jgi:dynactin complex subunit
MEFKCSNCDYKSTQKNKISRHINKINKCGDNPVIVLLNVDISCEYCKKSCRTRPSLNRHFTTCKIIKENTEIKLEIEKDNNKKLEKQSEYDNLQRKYDNLQKKYNKLEKTLESFLKIEKKVLGNTNVETIRSQARKKYKNSSKNMNCVHCKHSGSTQVCHIKAISDFDKLSTIEEINDITNLIGLCPNCHIDLDKHKKFEVLRTTTLHSMLVKC